MAHDPASHRSTPRRPAGGLPLAARLVTGLLVAAGCAGAGRALPAQPPAGAPSAAASPPAAARPAPAQPTAAPPAMVVVVRHAEKGDAPADDPPLSADGQARAEALARSLATADVAAVIVTPRRRTRDTGAPVAAARGLTPEVVPFGAGPTALDAHARAVAEAARRYPGRVVLVVGHSNTVPAIVAALGGPRLPDLCDASYATMFVVRPAAAPGTAAPVVRAQYGRADAPGADACAPPAPMR